MLDFVKDLKSDDEFDVYVLHDVDDEFEVVTNSIDLLEGSKCNFFKRKVII